MIVHAGTELSYECSYHRISSADLKVRVSLQNSIKHSGSERVKEGFNREGEREGERGREREREREGGGGLI